MKFGFLFCFGLTILFQPFSPVFGQVDPDRVERFAEMMRAMRAQARGPALRADVVAKVFSEAPGSLVLFDDSTISSIRGLLEKEGAEPQALEIIDRLEDLPTSKPVAANLRDRIGRLVEDPTVDLRADIQTYKSGEPESRSAELMKYVIGVSQLTQIVLDIQERHSWSIIRSAIQKIEKLSPDSRTAIAVQVQSLVSKRSNKLADELIGSRFSEAADFYRRVAEKSLIEIKKEAEIRDRPMWERSLTTALKETVPKVTSAVAEQKERSDSEGFHFGYMESERLGLSNKALSIQENGDYLYLDRHQTLSAGFDFSVNEVVFTYRFNGETKKLEEIEKKSSLTRENLKLRVTPDGFTRIDSEGKESTFYPPKFIEGEPSTDADVSDLFTIRDWIRSNPEAGDSIRYVVFGVVPIVSEAKILAKVTYQGNLYFGVQLNPSSTGVYTSDGVLVQFRIGGQSSRLAQRSLWHEKKAQIEQISQRIEKNEILFFYNSIRGRSLGGGIVYWIEFEKGSEVASAAKDKGLTPLKYIRDVTDEATYERYHLSAGSLGEPLRVKPEDRNHYLQSLNLTEEEQKFLEGIPGEQKLSIKGALEKLAASELASDSKPQVFSSLMRRQGIPTRRVWGLKSNDFQMHPEYLNILQWNVWCEVSVDGVWKPVDVKGLDQADIQGLKGHYADPTHTPFVDLDRIERRDETKADREFWKKAVTDNFGVEKLERGEK